MRKRINPFAKIYRACNTGSLAEKFAHLPCFPRYLDIELTNRCNFHCLMCPVGTSSIKRKKGFMDRELFHRILDEIQDHRTPLRFIRWGEPLLHPHILDFLTMAKSAGSLLHINTNGSLLSEDYMDAFIGIPVDSIKFSFQGVDRRSYREMRNIDFFDGLLDRIRVLSERRGDRRRPYIHVCTSITYETPEQVQAFSKRVAPYADQISIGRTVLEHIDIPATRLSEEDRRTLQHLKEQESVVKKRLDCPEIFDKLSINWDGTVSACCGDYDNLMLAGDVKQNSLHEIWYSDAINRFRRLLIADRHDDLPLCRFCYDALETQNPGIQKTGLT